MLFLLLKCLYLGLVSVVSGDVLLRILRGLFGLPQNGAAEPLPLAWLGILGLLGLSVAGAALALVMPLGLAANGILLGLVAAASWLHRRDLAQLARHYTQQLHQTPIWAKALWGISAGFALYLSAAPAITGDEGGYHAQFMRWTEDYGTVTGLCNVHHRLGFNSHWHVLSAFLSGSWSIGQSSYQLNMWLYLLAVGHLLGQLVAFAKTRSGFGIGLTGALLGLATLPPMMIYYLRDPSADLANMYLIWLALGWVLQTAGRGESLFQPLDNQRLAIIFTCLALPTIKLSSAPMGLLLVGFAGAWLMRGAWRALGALVAVGLSVVGLWLWRNYLLSGYFVCPVEATVFLHPAWQMPAATAQYLREAIYEMAWQLYSEQRIDNAHLPFGQRVATWFGNNLRIYEQAIIAGGFVCIAGAGLWSAWRRDLRWLAGLLAAGAAFWFLQAPDPRFGYGFTGFGLALGAGLAGQFLGRSWRASAGAMTAAIGLMLLGLQAVSIQQHGRLHAKFVARGIFYPTHVQTPIWLLPAPYPRFVGDTVLVDGQPFYRTRFDNCWDTYPCFYDSMPTARLRGNDFAAGFLPRQ